MKHTTENCESRVKGIAFGGLSVQPISLVLDFDGTIAAADVGDAICDEFAPPSWRDIDQAWLRGELSLPEAQRRMWPLVRCAEAELRAFLGRIGALRPGFAELMDLCRERRVEVVVASGGFDLYLDILLAPWADRLRVVTNHAWLANGGVQVSFPHRDLACARCAICKGEVVRRERSRGRRVGFAGDGSSDRCAAGVAEALFVVPGGVLEQHVRAQGVAYTRMPDFGPLTGWVAREAARP